MCFAGWMTDAILAETLERHACMVIPSLWDEPFGIVALEGLACCGTVISSNRGGLPEAVGDCGLLVEPSVDALAQAMLDVVRARRAGETLPGEPSPEARVRHLAQHSPARVARSYLAVCLAGRNRS